MTKEMMGKKYEMKGCCYNCDRTFIVKFAYCEAVPDPYACPVCGLYRVGNIVWSKPEAGETDLYRDSA